VWDAQTGDVRGAAGWSRHVDKSGGSMLECPASNCLKLIAAVAAVADPWSEGFKTASQLG